MNWRKRKKLRKRGGLFHYRDWKALHKFLIYPTRDDVIASTWECKMNQFRMKYVKDIQKVFRCLLRGDTSLEAMMINQEDDTFRKKPKEEIQKNMGCLNELEET